MLSTSLRNKEVADLSRGECCCRREPGWPGAGNYCWETLRPTRGGCTRWSAPGVGTSSVYYNFTVQAWNSNKCELCVIEVQFTSTWVTFLWRWNSNRNCSTITMRGAFNIPAQNPSKFEDLNWYIWMLQGVTETETNLCSCANKKQIHQVRTGALRRQAADQQVEQVCLQAWRPASQTWGLRSSGGVFEILLRLCWEWLHQFMSSSASKCEI